jgi:hypothetical protein
VTPVALAAALAFAQPAPVPGPAAVPPPAAVTGGACSEGPYHQFDFLIGEWTAFAAGGADVAGHVKVSRVADGCGLLEEATPTKGPPVTALYVYDPASTLWRRESVAGDGQLISLQGGLQNGEMTLEGEQAGTADHSLARIVWRTQGQVINESGERSSDGRDWSTWFDLELHKAR